MIKIEDKSKCCGCYGCYNICPKDAIEMKSDEKGFKYPVVNKEKCVNCHLCEKVCPILNKVKSENKPVSYAAYNKNDEVRFRSSSGGIFSLLAEYVLDNNGVVYGAAFNSDWQVEHIRVDNKTDLEKLRTSKYVQSSIKDTYKLAKQDLNNGLKVLFTGTPCQINGLLEYLKKEYSNLYTQDIICHGVPSPKVWNKYLEYRRQLDYDSPKQINFRHKGKGWNSYSLLLKYNNGEYKVNHYKDLFMQAFLRDACLRDSCYECSFKDTYRKTDITLADFWGVKNVVPEFDDDKGISLVIVNTEKGRELFNYIKSKIVWKETDFEESIKYNSAMYCSAIKPKGRDKFFENLENMTFDKLVDKYTDKPKKVSIFRKFIRKIKKIIKNKQR